jgi:predicted MFS family arabinose efflux permease
MEAAQERKILAVLVAVQFINIVDFMMVMPLGPDFARALSIPVSELGIVGGAYTFSACIAGLVGSLFLDKFDRRSALAVSMVGLLIGTALGAFAQGYVSLVAARLVAGAFGGPASALVMAIVSDVIPPARRGKAVGILMGAFAAASVLGVPFGLKVAEWGSWRTPFYVLAGFGGLVAFSAYRLLPKLDAHLGRTATRAPHLLRAEVWLSLTLTFFVNFATFLMVPNFATFLQHNLGYPRDKLGLLYMVGGAVSLVTTRLAGVTVDRVGSAKVGIAGVLSVCFVMYAVFIHEPSLIPPFGFFAAFMFSMGMRNVAAQSIATKVPTPEERARFGSFTSAVQHGACAAGAFLSTKILAETATHRLVHMDRAAWVSIGSSVLIPMLLLMLEKRMKQRAF